MTHGVLIVEDNEGVASLLQELCALLHVPCTWVRGGTEAIALLRKEMPALLIVDLVLSELDGFQVIRAARQLPEGADCPILVISGVYTRLPAEFEEAMKVRFLPKPFDPGIISNAIRSAMSVRDEAEGIRRGSFGETSPASLLVQLASDNATGLLDIFDTVDPETRRRLYLDSGTIRYAVSNLQEESAGALQVAQGNLRGAAFARALGHSKEVGVPLHESLATTRALSPPELTRALAAQTREVAAKAMGMTEASWIFTEMDVDRQPSTPMSPLVPVLDHARSAVNTAEIRRALSRCTTGRVVRSELLKRESATLREEWPGETIVSILSTAQPDPALWLARATRDELPLAWALLTSGLVKVEPSASGNTANTEDTGDAEKGSGTAKVNTASLSSDPTSGQPKASGQE